MDALHIPGTGGSVQLLGVVTVTRMKNNEELVRETGNA